MTNSKQIFTKYKYFALRKTISNYMHDNNDIAKTQKMQLAKLQKLQNSKLQIVNRE